MSFQDQEVDPLMWMVLIEPCQHPGKDLLKFLVLVCFRMFGHTEPRAIVTCLFGCGVDVVSWGCFFFGLLERFG